MGQILKEKEIEKLKKKVQVLEAEIKDLSIYLTGVRTFITTKELDVELDHYLDNFFKLICETPKNISVYVSEKDVGDNEPNERKV